MNEFMKKTTCLAVLLSLTATQPAARAQPLDPIPIAISAQALVDQGDRRQDNGDIDRGIALLRDGLGRYPDDPLLLHYLGYALYRKSESLEARAADPLLREADKYLQASEARDGLAETPALRAIILGQLISTNPRHLVSLADVSDFQMRLALKLGPKNPRVWLLRGIGAMYAPAVAGGSLDQARQFLLKAKGLFDGDAPAAGKPSWGRQEVDAWLGQVYARRGQYELATAAYEGVLRATPDYFWVRDVLVPRLRDAEHGRK